MLARNEFCTVSLKVYGSIARASPSFAHLKTAASTGPAANPAAAIAASHNLAVIEPPVLPATTRDPAPVPARSLARPARAGNRVRGSRRGRGAAAPGGDFR